MDKTRIQKIVSTLILIISLIVFIVGNIVNNFNVILCGVLFLVLHNIVYSLENIKENVVFFIFNINFFTLLLGRDACYMLSNEVWYNKFDSSIEKNTLLLIYISLISIRIGVMIYKLYKRKMQNNKQEECNNNDNNSNNYEKEIVIIRKFLRIAFIVTFIPSIMVTIERIIYLNQNSYVDLFVNFSSKMPFVIQKLADMNFTFFILYLTTFPSKKETLLITGIYTTYLVMTVFTGGRGKFVTKEIILIIYYVYRQYNLNEKYFTKKIIAILGIIVMALIIFLSAYNTLRNKQEIENFNPAQQFRQFFIDQGGAIDIISYAQKFKQQLPETNQNYTFGIIINVVMNKTQYIQNTNTEETAFYGNNLGATLSYFTMGNAFLRGHGLGTQYIAELYTDFSYIGVIIYNVLLGISLNIIMDIKKQKYIVLALVLSILEYLIYLPRQFAMVWTTYLLSSTIIFLITLMIIVTKMVRRKIENENTLDS